MPRSRPRGRNKREFRAFGFWCGRLPSSGLAPETRGLFFWRTILKPDLRSITAELPEPPYGKIKAGACPFFLDVHRIEQSDTWLVASPDERPWLLMLWAMSWKRIPCGTLPADESIIRGLIGCTSAFWKGHREVLMRGWVMHSDGRYYHSTITELVERSEGKRATWRAGKSKARNSVVKEKQGHNGNVLAESEGSPSSSSPTCTSTCTSTLTPTPTSALEDQEQEPPLTPPSGGNGSKPKKSWPVPDWVNPEAWKEWEQHRKGTKGWSDLARTKAANRLKGHSHEVQQQIIDNSIQAGWSGLFADKRTMTAMEAKNRKREASDWASGNDSGGVLFSNLEKAVDGEIIQ